VNGASRWSVCAESWCRDRCAGGLFRRAGILTSAEVAGGATDDAHAAVSAGGVHGLGRGSLTGFAVYFFVFVAICLAASRWSPSAMPRGVSDGLGLFLTVNVALYYLGVESPAAEIRLGEEGTGGLFAERVAFPLLIHRPRCRIDLRPSVAWDSNTRPDRPRLAYGCHQATRPNNPDYVTRFSHMPATRPTRATIRLPNPANRGPATGDDPRILAPE
jgi:hypothetical protein